ncbi:hypothetical protein HGRIS_008839 [Hohenbuehelia grisea]|uniref:Uncharacterized protein n=1 Tax=Hohenbuehelia grisea TaxID=104357 RepID=A0ABR3IZT5_9AGAR
MAAAVHTHPPGLNKGVLRQRVYRLQMIYHSSASPTPLHINNATFIIPDAACLGSSLLFAIATNGSSLSTFIAATTHKSAIFITTFSFAISSRCESPSLLMCSPPPDIALPPKLPLDSERNP